MRRSVVERTLSGSGCLLWTAEKCPWQHMARLTKGSGPTWALCHEMGALSWETAALQPMSQPDMTSCEAFNDLSSFLRELRIFAQRLSEE